MTRNHEGQYRPQHMAQHVYQVRIPMRHAVCTAGLACALAGAPMGACMADTAEVAPEAIPPIALEQEPVDPIVSAAQSAAAGLGSQLSSSILDGGVASAIADPEPLLPDIAPYLGGAAIALTGIAAGSGIALVASRRRQGRMTDGVELFDADGQPVSLQSLMDKGYGLVDPMGHVFDLCSIDSLGSEGEEASGPASEAPAFVPTPAPAFATSELLAVAPVPPQGFDSPVQPVVADEEAAFASFMQDEAPVEAFVPSCGPTYDDDPDGTGAHEPRRFGSDCDDDLIATALAVLSAGGAATRDQASFGCAGADDTRMFLAVGRHFAPSSDEAPEEDSQTSESFDVLDHEALAPLNVISEDGDIAAILSLDSDPDYIAPVIGPTLTTSWEINQRMSMVMPGNAVRDTCDVVPFAVKSAADSAEFGLPVMQDRFAAPVNQTPKGGIWGAFAARKRDESVPDLGGSHVMPAVSLAMDVPTTSFLAVTPGYVNQVASRTCSFDFGIPTIEPSYGIPQIDDEVEFPDVPESVKLIISLADSCPEAAPSIVAAYASSVYSHATTEDGSSFAESGRHFVTEEHTVAFDSQQAIEAARFTPSCDEMDDSVYARFRVINGAASNIVRSDRPARRRIG